MNQLVNNVPNYYLDVFYIFDMVNPSFFSGDDSYKEIPVA